MAAANFWDDQELAQDTVAKAAHLKEEIKTFFDLQAQLEEIAATWELAKEADDEELAAETEKGLAALKKAQEKLELSRMLSGPYDNHNAILALHAGAGGVEAQDWVSMLSRMYTRYCERSGYKVEVLDFLDGEEAGLKSMTIGVSGYNAYGYLKAEKGVHRLVRLSPFDAANRRHTSFASVEVMPEVAHDNEIEVDNEELRIDTYRSGGKGGQHLNKTDSAVRITHIPTGIVTSCQEERSQHANKERAMRMLKAKLLERKIEEQEAELAKIRGVQQEIGWGSQIRSYIFQPYQLVKDHRTNFENGNIGAVMDGDLQDFIDAYLKMQMHA